MVENATSDKEVYNNELPELPERLEELRLRQEKAYGLAIKFHETYERLAPDFGYETRLETREFDPLSNNGRLMIAVCAEILKIEDIF